MCKFIKIKEILILSAACIHASSRTFLQLQHVDVSTFTRDTWRQHPAPTNPTDPDVKAGGGGKFFFCGFFPLLLLLLPNPDFHGGKKEKERQSISVSTGAPSAAIIRFFFSSFFSHHKYVSSFLTFSDRRFPNAADCKPQKSFTNRLNSIKFLFSSRIVIPFPSRHQ